MAGKKKLASKARKPAKKAKAAPARKAKAAPARKAKAAPARKAKAAPARKAKAAPAAKSGSAPTARAKVKAAPSAGGAGKAASRLIDERIQALADWRGEALAEVRRWIHEADPEVVEECKWVKVSNPLGVPVWSHAGIICTGETYKEVVKLTFMRGASLADGGGLFNSSLDGGTRRAIDIREGETLDAEAFQELIRAAVAENLGSRAS